MLEFPKPQLGVVPRPNLIFTLRGNSQAEAVIAQLQKLSIRTDAPNCSYRIFATHGEIESHFATEHSPGRAVAVFDGSHRSRRCFSQYARGRERDQNALPKWSAGARWGVGINPNTARIENCAFQIRANFLRNFDASVGNKSFPWGNPRKKEHGPEAVILDSTEVSRILEALSSGPDLASAIANPKFLDRLPAGSRISWNRIPTKPLVCNHSRWQAIDNAFREFEQSCNRLLESERSCSQSLEDCEVRRMILAGVTFAHPRMQGIYLRPSTDSFSVRRPDLHYQGTDQFFASENDEMPGGIAELVHLDRVYGVNHHRWEQAFDWLFNQGPVLFVVSSNWSRVYIAELQWLVENLRKAGYDAYFAASDNLANLDFKHDEIKGDRLVYWGETRIGTIWRQFPIFETAGKLAELVILARAGIVRMVPEFAHFGNKAWFSVYRRYRDWFRKELAPETDAILDKLLPDSHLVRNEADFPLTVAGITIPNLEALRNLGVLQRNQLVLKVTGANELAARSHGVLMDRDLDQHAWRAWIDARLQAGIPFIVQQQMTTAVVHLPVQRLDRSGPTDAELFPTRVLIRPWSLGGRVVSAHAAAVTHATRKAHGMTDMAVHAVDFGD
jgi:hypothetical protein